jgi:hypothetical protein
MNHTCCYMSHICCFMNHTCYYMSHTCCYMSRTCCYMSRTCWAVPERHDAPLVPDTVRSPPFTCYSMTDTRNRRGPGDGFCVRAVSAAWVGSVRHRRCRVRDRRRGGARHRRHGVLGRRLVLATIWRLFYEAWRLFYGTWRLFYTA